MEGMDRPLAGETAPGARWTPGAAGCMLGRAGTASRPERATGTPVPREEGPMGVLERLFGVWHGRGRLAREPSGHTGGRLAPASVQRAHLGLKDVDLPAGVLRLRTGEVRAVLTVGGVPLHHRDPEDALDFLERWAAALTALPPDVALLSRARPGGLDAYAAEKAQAATALATAAPGTGLARLAADQLRNARALVAAGAARDVVAYLAVRDARGDVRALLERAAGAAGRLTAVGLRVVPLRDRALAAAIGASWRPGLTDGLTYDYWVRGHRGEAGYEWTLNVDSDGRATRATVHAPRYVDPGSLPTQASPPAAALPGSRTRPRRPLPDGPRKALP
jgi:hypothetical protein